MADNTQLNANTTTGDLIASDEISGAKHQRVKLSIGPDGSATDASSADPVPIFNAGSATFDVVNAGTFATQENGALLTAAELLDDTVYTDDGDWTALSSKHNLIGGVYQSSPGSITDGDTGPFRLSENGAIHIHDGGNTITIDGTVTANAGSGTFTVDLGANNDVTVQGEDAENAAASANPVQVGGRYDASPRTLGDGDVGALALDADGALHISDGGNTITVDGTVTANLSATDNAVLDQIELNTSYGDNTGGGTESGALRVTMANDSTGVLSVDDNGGSLTVDNADITTIAGAVSGAEMQVDIVSPGTSATSLGKAIDDVVGGSDVGVATLVKHQEDQLHLTTADGDYDILSSDSLGSLHVNAEAHHIFDDLNATTGWSAFGNDTLNLATTKKHILGTDALTFDKVDGAENTVFAGIEKTITSVDIGSVSPHDIIQTVCYTSSIATLNYVFVRLGTDSSNYNEWRIDADNLTAGSFDTLAFIVGDADHTGITGNGWDESAITYIAVGFAFDSESDTLSGLIFDQLSYHTNQHTTTSITAEVSSSVSSPNVRLNGYGGSTDVNSGNLSNNTLRVTNATDDVNLSAIKTSVELQDDTVYTDSDAWTASTSKHTLTGGVYNATPVTVTDGDTAPLQTDVNGHLITSPHADTIALTDNVTNTANIQVDEAGAFMANATFGYYFDGSTWDRMRGDSTNGLTVNLGSNNDVTVSSISAGSNLVGDVGISGARTSGGTTPYKNIDVDESEDQVKGSGGQVYWVHVINLASSTRYLKFYNATAASVTVGTTVPDLTFPIPTAGDTNGAGFVLPIVNGIAFSTAITIAATTGIADNDSGAPGANEVIVNLGYA